MISRRKKPGGRAVAAGIGMALIMGIIAGRAYAYMSDRDKGINTLTVGNVHIEATEPEFPTKDENNNGVPDECELIIPYETILKDPRIKNTGKNDAVVFFKVTSPVEELTLISDDGTRQGTSPADLFWFKLKGDGEETHANHFNQEWVQLASLDGEFVDCPGINEEGKGYTYIFGYHTRIKPGESTKTLFDKVQNKKYGSKTIGPNEVETIRLEAFAIQADEIAANGGTVFTDGEISESDLTYIYNVFFNQNKERVK